VNGADVLVVQQRSRLGLLDEAVLGRFVPDQLGRQELQGDDALELGVLGLVHDTHAAAADALQDAVMGDHVADHRGLDAERMGSKRAILTKASPKIDTVQCITATVDQLPF